MALVGGISGSFGLIGISGSMEPAVDNAYSLGNSGKKWSTVVATALSGSLTKLADGTSFMVAGDNITITTGSNGSVTIASTASGGGGGGDSAAQYLVLSATGSLSDERVFTAGTGIGVTDGGAGGNFTVAIDNSVVATLTGSAFSGGITGTTLSMSGNVTGSNVLVNGDLTVKGNTTLGDANGDVVTITGTSVNLTSTSATSITHTGASGQNLTISSTSGNTIIESTIFNGNDVTVPGNLTVNGTLVSIDTTNLRIKDPVVLIGSGSGVADAKSAIAFGSGSSGGTNSLIVGSVGSANTIAAAQQDVEAGNLAPSSLNFTNLVPFRASKFEVGGTSAYVTSSVGSDLTVFANGAATVQANTGKVILSGAAGFGTSFEIGGVQYAELKDSSSNVQFGAVGRLITVSGSTVQLNTGGSVNIQQHGARIGQLVGGVGNNFRVLALDAAGATTTAILSGSALELGANSQGVTLKFADVGRGSISYGANTLQVGTTTGVALSLSGTNGVTVVHGNNGTSFARDTGSPAYLVVEGDGIDARFRASADINLRADGGDIKFTSGSSTPLTITVAGNNANIQGANNQQVAIGAVGNNGIMNVSGSTINANAGVGGFVFQRDGIPELHVNALGSTTTISGSATQNVTLAAGTGATTLALSGSTVNLVGSSVNLYQDSTLVAYAGSIGGTRGFFPNADSSYNLGDPTRRWANIYTGDLHLRNERGNWTIIEEADFLTITNTLNGKRYKFVMEEL